MRITGLCLVLAAIAGAVALSSLATASEKIKPEYGFCEKLTKSSTPKEKKGQYENAGCTRHSQKCKTKSGVESCTLEEKGDYEWRSAPVPNCEKVKKKKGKYEDAACTHEKVSSKGKDEGEYERRGCAPNCNKISAHGGTAFLENESKTVKIEATENGAELGEYLSGEKATGVAVYKHTEFKGVKCNSAGAAEGEIKTSVLEATPEEVEWPAGSHKMGVFVKYTNEHNAHAPYLAEFECGAIAKFRVSGFAAGAVTGGVNEMALESTQTFSAAAGPQDLNTEIDKGSGYESIGASYQNQTTTFKSGNTEGAEIRTEK
jgi:hypothetical protein